MDTIHRRLEDLMEMEGAYYSLLKINIPALRGRQPILMEAQACMFNHSVVSLLDFSSWTGLLFMCVYMPSFLL